MQTTTKSFKILPAKRAIVTDILSQAITGELIAMSNFTTLSEVTADLRQKMDAVEHAYGERNHAEGFINVAATYDLRPLSNIDGQYWKAIRNCFLKYARRNDYIACLIMQEIMLECFAVSMYDDIGTQLGNSMGDFFCSIAEEEREHIDHAIEVLLAEVKKSPAEFAKKTEQIHWDFMTILSRWTAKADLGGHCGVCAGNCMKDSLHEINLTITGLRGNALNLYVTTLAKLGISTQKSLPWIINLPA